MPMMRYRKAAGCIVRNDGMILLLRRSVNETSYHGLWELPGGKVEGEAVAGSLVFPAPEDTAITETVEETRISKLIGTNILLEPHIDHDMEKVYYGYVVDVFGKTPNTTLSDEHDAFMWITVEGALTIEPLSHHAHFLLSQL